MLNDYLYWAPRIVLIAAAFTFPVLFFITAGYGRHASGKGFTVPAKLGWVVMESPSVFLFALGWVTNPSFGAPMVTTLGLAWLLHYVQRTFIFTALMRGPQKRMPFYVMLLAVFFNLLNGPANGASLTERSLDVWFFVGLAVFLAGFVINVHADHVLRNLRKPGETGYAIPRGGLYGWISAPNYFGELIEWLGFAIAAQTLPAWAFFVFTGANLIPRAWSNHKWYREKFPDYPAQRRALLPFIW